LLRQITIKNFAIVDSVTMEFGPGFNVLTGETGAGKSLIVDALYFLLGDRIAADMLRSGEERAMAEALFQVSVKSPAAKKISEWGIETPGGEILIKREFNRASGKTRSFLNGEMATASMIEELSELLIDIHGQHEHQAIFNVSRHRQLVDAFGHNSSGLEKVQKAYQVLADLLAEQKRLGGDAKAIARRTDLLSFQVQEINDAGIANLNEEELLQKFQLFKYSEKIVKQLTEAQRSLDEEGEGGSTGLFGTVVSRLQDSAKLDPSLESFLAESKALQEGLNQLSFDLSRKLESYTFSENEYQELSDRIDELNTLKKKYGDSVPEILKYHESIEEELKTLLSREVRLKTIAQEIEEAAGKYRKAAHDLSQNRLKVGKSLALQVQESLKELGLSHAQLNVEIKPVEESDSPVIENGIHLQISPLGWDRVEFLFSANPGEPLRPLAKVASGGEASRVMLGLKTILAESDDVPTLIFDEIDTGVGARTAPAVATLLTHLSRSKQVLCISHLAPIAGLGDWHFQVAKSIQNGKTSVSVNRLTESQRIEELAKMLGGEPISETSISHAKELYARMHASS